MKAPKDYTLQCRINEGEKRHFKTVCAKNNMSQSEAIRFALTKAKLLPVKKITT